VPRSWLSPGGTLAALAVGAAVALGAGWPGLGLLLVFFLSSTLLTPGGGRRRAVQVAANGGAAAAAALLSLGDPVWRLAFAGALAAAAADTWSTEIGSRSRRAPRLVTTRRSVPRGTSGGVTRLGSAGGAAGAACVAAAAAGLGVVTPLAAPLVAAAGVAAGWVDSLLGATLQARYRCPACEADCETPRHACGAATRPAGGLPWMTNDAVNLAATLVGAALALLPVLFGVAGLSSR
jgi:uncharacterized protein (TIGR00297 family)